MIEATAGLLEDHVPPEVGVTFVVAPTQIVLGPVKLTTGGLLTVTGAEAADTQPEASVNVKVADPAFFAVTTPPLVIVATEVSLLAHVPPDAGVSVVVAPIQIRFAPVMVATGLALMVTGVDGSLGHSVSDDVNINWVEPGDTPVTTPKLFIVAMDGLSEDHVPPEAGV